MTLEKKEKIQEKKNLVSGMRATGKLHLGHYMGVLKNWITFQNSNKYNCFFFVADWHSLTTKYSETSELRKNIIEVTKDFLAAGLDPEKSCVYVQSWVPQIAELHLLFSMLTPNNWLEGAPTLKDLVKAAQNSQISELTYGMLGYPVLQSADILAFKASLVPVGKDQESHLEIARDIARRFNHTFKTDLMPEPKALFTETSLLLGVDGCKMSKSFKNDIKLSATEDETLKQVKAMITDIERKKRDDKGSTDRCQVPFGYYKIFTNEQTQAQVKTECESAQRGCMDCKVQ